MAAYWTTSEEDVFAPSGADRPNGLFAHGAWDVTSKVEGQLPGGENWANAPLRLDVTATCPGVPGCACGARIDVGGVDCGSIEPHTPSGISRECICFLPVTVRVALGKIGLNEDADVLRRRAVKTVLALLETAAERQLANGGTAGDCEQTALFDPAAIPTWATDGGAPIPMPLATALGDLEQLIVEQGGGVIHAPYRLGARLLAAGLIVRSGTTATTAVAGVPIILGAGYPGRDIGSGPSVLAAGPGQAWLAASGPVQFLRQTRADVQLITTSAKNLREVWASQSAMAVWNPTVHAVVLTAEQGCC